MKKSLLILLTAVSLGLFVASCNKDDANNNQQQNSTVQGTWSGTGQYGTGPGNPTYPFTLTFNTGGTVNITGNNNTAADNAVGTWQMVGDSVQATYKYTSSSAIYRLSGKFTAGSNAMAGTIGLDPATTLVGIFSVTRQP